MHMVREVLLKALFKKQKQCKNTDLNSSPSDIKFATFPNFSRREVIGH